VQVEFDPARVQPEELITAIEDAGFEGSVLSVRALATASGKDVASAATAKSTDGAAKGVQTVHTGVLTVKNMTAQRSCEEVQALLMKCGGVLRAAAEPKGGRVELLYLSGNLQQVCGAGAVHSRQGHSQLWHGVLPRGNWGLHVDRCGASNLERHHTARSKQGAWCSIMHNASCSSDI
jgi:hypothetical protein